ncbi:MAG: hypothetical protein ACRDOK_12175 [Streptosporangiaceae bacterium]
MPGMKISLDAAMRARDVSEPSAAHEEAAAGLAEAQDRAQSPGRAPKRPRSAPGDGASYPRGEGSAGSSPDSS